MDRTLTEIARELNGFSHISTKPEYYYNTYDKYFSPLRDAKDFKMMELGVYNGDSLKIFGSYFTNGHVIGIDMDKKTINLANFPNTKIEQANQQDVKRLQEISD